MTLMGLLLIAIKLSIFTTVLSFGLRATRGDLMFLFRRPRLLAHALLSIFVVMPVVAVVLTRLFRLDPVLATVLIALSVSPVPPMLPNNTLKNGGERSFTYGLMAAVAALAVVIPPAVAAFIGFLYDRASIFSITAIVAAVCTPILFPLIGGTLIRQVAPDIAERIADPLHKAATVLLILAFLPVLIAFLPTIISLLGSGWLLMCLAFAVIGLAVGYFLGGTAPGERTVLSISTAARHPAIAVSLAAGNVNDEQQKLVVAAVVVYAVVSGLLSAPCVAWFLKRTSPAAEVIDAHK